MYDVKHINSPGNLLLVYVFGLLTKKLSTHSVDYRSGSTLAQVMVSCLMASSHYLNQYWIFMAFYGAHLEPISQKVPLISICNMSLKNMVVTLPPHLPRADKLIHWGRVTHICISRLAIIGSNNGLMPDRHQAIIWIYLNQCWNVVNWTLGNEFEWNLNWNIYIFIQEHAFENVFWKMASILPLPQCCKQLHHWSPVSGSQMTSSCPPYKD